MESKKIDKYLKRVLGEHFSYMPKGECKVNATEKMIEFTFNPARVSKKFIEACTPRHELYRYIKEATAKKVVMEFPIEESTESMMTPIGLTFTGKRTLQCDSEGKEILREEVDTVPVDERYYVAAYFDSRMRGLNDNLLTNSFEEVSDFVWDEIQNGSYIEVRDQLNGNYVILNPDDYDFESDDLYRVLDDLKKLNSISESLTEADDNEGFEEDDGEEELELDIEEEEDTEDTSSDDNSKYAELSRKTVYDSDGFMTDYTLYKDRDRDRYICIFGDQDFYNPDNSDPDVEFEREAEAYEWFNSYEGIIDEDDFRDWDNDVERFDNPESPYYNGDLEDSDFDEDEESEEEEEVEEESLQLKTESIGDNTLTSVDILEYIEHNFPEVVFNDDRDLGNGMVELIFNHNLSGQRLFDFKRFLESAGVTGAVIKTNWITIPVPEDIEVLDTINDPEAYRDFVNYWQGVEDRERLGRDFARLESLQLKFNSKSKDKSLKEWWDSPDDPSLNYPDPIEEEVHYEFPIDAIYDSESLIYDTNPRFLGFESNEKINIENKDHEYLTFRYASDLVKDMWQGMELQKEDPRPEDDTGKYHVTGIVDFIYYFNKYYNGLVDLVEEKVQFKDLKFTKLDKGAEEDLQARNSIKEDYWFGGDGKIDTPVRNDIQQGDEEFELRIDDVTKDNEDQNEEEQEEELNEDISSDSSTTATEVVDDLESKFKLYYEGGSPGGFKPLDKSKVILSFTYSFLDDKPLAEIENYLKSKGLKYRLRKSANKLVVEADKDNLKLRPMDLNEDYLPSEFYTVRFCRIDGDEDEIYEYKDLKDAEYHFNLFDDSDADIYTWITIEDPKGKIIKTKELKSIEEDVKKDKKVSFKDKHICQGCGNPLSKCTCEVKEEELKEDATQPSNIGQHKRSSIDMVGEDKEISAEDSEMVQSLDKMVGKR